MDWDENRTHPFGTNTNKLTKITRVLAHPHDPDQVWATAGYYHSGEKVFYSTDGAQTWQNHSLGLPNFPVNCIVMDKNSGNIFVGTDVGVYYKHSTDGASTPWQSFGYGLPRVMVSEIRINHNFNKLVAACFGRGVWEIKLDCPTGTTYLPTSFNGFYKDGNVIGNTIQDNAKTTIVRAMDKITFTTGFNSTPTGYNKLSAKVIPCATPGVVDPCSGYMRYVESESDDNEGINEFRSNITVYPNPNTGEFNVGLEKIEGDVSIHVLNSIGSIVLSVENNSKSLIKLNIKDQPVGIYFVKITSGNNVKVEKIIKK